MTNEELALIAERPTCCKPFGESVSLSRAERDQLVALARDGMRYQWLRVGENDEKVMRGTDVENTWLLRRKYLDEAIDAEMAKAAARD